MSFFRPLVLTPALQATVAELKQQQLKLRSQIITEPLPAEIRTIAGCDSALMGENILSVVVIFSYPDLVEIETQFHRSPATLPYIPGFLSFREIPNLLKTFAKVQTQPDVVMVDGQGILHPQRLGIATQLGIELNLPTVGVAKKKLIGHYEMPGDQPGDYSPLYDKNEQLAFVVRSKAKVKPIFVSPGHKCDLPSALQLTLATLRQYKLPEPTRIADKYSKEFKAKF